MIETQASPPVLAELKAFLEFLSGLWGLLAGIATLFPLSSLLVQTIPLASFPGGGFAYFPSAVVSVTATIGCIFVVLWTFGQRAAARSWSARSTHRRAWRAFLAGLFCFISYLAIYFVIANDFYWSALHWESGDLRRIAGDVLLLALYAAGFALLTRAFVLLALFEFLKPTR